MEGRQAELCSSRKGVKGDKITEFKMVSRGLKMGHEGSSTKLREALYSKTSVYVCVCVAAVLEVCFCPSLWACLCLREHVGGDACMGKYVQAQKCFYTVGR